jgi:hypothetical protein
MFIGLNVHCCDALSTGVITLNTRIRRSPRIQLPFIGLDKGDQGRRLSLIIQAAERMARAKDIYVPLE